MGFKRPKDIRVLCFPGAEQEGEEALEIYKIYDPLGIPRKNITGLEREYEIFDRLRRANLGINLEHTTDIKFFEKARERYRGWDVISLDYTSYFNDLALYALELIASDGLLGNSGILNTNFLGKRENKEAQELMRYIYRYLKYPITVSELFGDPDRFLKRDDTPFNVKDRSYSIRNVIISTFGFGKSLLDINTYENILTKKTSEEDIISILESRPQLYEIYSLDGRDLKEKFCRAYRLYLMKELWEELTHRGLEYHDLYLMDILSKKSYFLEDSESYYYVSNTGSPMLFDLFFFDRNEKYLRPFLDYFAINTEKKQLRFLPLEKDPLKRSGWKVNLSLTAIALIDKQNKALNNIERISLGSSCSERRKSDEQYKPSQEDYEKERISKDDAKYLLNEGVSIKEILATYSGFTDYQLRGFKAHITRKTYDKS
ncbi:MAG: hypothetical protein QMD85_00190 [Candidatus Aenigmarchaeota archaeon]|nr:hypothetical protein [Candidatus Aenigmarchaeota archaeon]